jgi:superoxide dismutase, Cu-Zn family
VSLERQLSISKGSKKMKNLILISSLFTLLATFASSASAQTAQAELKPTQGNQTKGTVSFWTTEENGKKAIKVDVDISGLTPGKHGFHIHEFGDCSAPDGTSAGGHFNPTTKDHGAPTNEHRHSGDLGNILADESGNAKLSVTDQTIALTGENSIIGKSVIVHAGEDDFKTQPTGNAGARVACGIILDSTKGD